MNKYENYLKEKLDNAESRIESLYYQLSEALTHNASMAVQNANLSLENQGLTESVRLFSDEYVKNLELQEALKKCYDIAYDLMPAGICAPKVMDYAFELKSIYCKLKSEG